MSADQEEKVDEALFRQLKGTLQLQALVHVGGLAIPDLCLERQYVWVKQSSSFLVSTEQNQKIKKWKCRVTKRTTMKRSTVAFLQY